MGELKVEDARVRRMGRRRGVGCMPMPTGYVKQTPCTRLSYRCRTPQTVRLTDLSVLNLLSALIKW